MLIQNVSGGDIDIEINNAIVTVPDAGVLNLSEQDASSVLNNYSTEEIIQVNLVSLTNGALTDGKIWIGNGSDLPAERTMSGDVTISNTGVATLGANKVITSKILNANVTGAKLVTAKGYFTACLATDGTNVVDFFAASLAFGGTITNIKITSLDTTAGNIIITTTGGVVDTIAKGTVAGVVTGAVALANATFAVGEILTIESSSAGNALVEITFEVA